MTHWDEKGERFAAAGLGGAEQVVALESDADRFALNLGRLRVGRLAQAVQRSLAQRKVLKCLDLARIDLGVAKKQTKKTTTAC